MSLINKILLLTGCVFSILCPTHAFAINCTRTSLPAYNLDMGIGTIIVSPDLKVGDKITEKEFTLSGAAGKYIECWNAGALTLYADLVASNRIPLYSHIYSTNVKGIGIRLTRYNADRSIEVVYPNPLIVNMKTPGAISLANTKFKVELFKTENETGSGVITSGEYTRFGMRGTEPMLITSLSGNSMVIVSPSCTVEGGRNIRVDLPVVNKKQLQRKGDTAGRIDFDIGLLCSGGGSISGSNTVNISYSGQSPKGISGAIGVLDNTKEGGSSAKGIGIQVLEGKETDTPLNLNNLKKYKVGVLNKDTTQRFSVPLHARYYQFNEISTPGEVESQMSFNLTYD